MFKLNGVLDFLKNELNYTHSELLNFCNVVVDQEVHLIDLIDGICEDNDVMIKGSDIEVILGITNMRKLECEVVQYISLN